MSDDAPDPMHENTLLASAYLDGEATTDERALVETSPEALSEVAALSQLRDVVAATAPQASLSERESHLAGALDVWERMSDRERLGEATPSAGVDAAAAAALTTPVSTSEGRRGRSRRGDGRNLVASQWFLSAAAIVVVVAGVAAVARGFLADDLATNEVAVQSAEADGPLLSEVELNEAAELDGENVGATVVPDAEAIADEVARDPDSVDVEADAAVDDGGLFAEGDAEEEATDDTAAAAEPAADELPEGASQPAPAPEFDRVELADLEDLADYGFLAVRGAAPGVTLPPQDIEFEPPQDTCEFELGIEKLLEPASYQGAEVNIGVDLDTNAVLAYTDDCAVVATTALPTEDPTGDTSDVLGQTGP